MSGPWRTRKDKRRYQKRDRVDATRDPVSENDSRRRLLIGRRGKAFIGKESFTKEDVDELIEFNRRLMEKRGNAFIVNRAGIEAVFSELDRFRSISDHRERVLSKAAWIIYRIAEGELFHDGRKTTASTVAIQFMKWNGYDLLIELLPVKQEFFALTKAVQHHKAGFEDVKEFLKRNAITFRSR